MNSNVIDLWTRRPIEPDSVFWPDANPVRVEDRFRNVPKGAHWTTAEAVIDGEVAEGSSS